MVVNNVCSYINLYLFVFNREPFFLLFWNEFVWSKLAAIYKVVEVLMTHLAIAQWQQQYRLQAEESEKHN